MMKARVLHLCVVASIGLVVGCPFVPPTPSEAVLEGIWTITPADPGDFAGFTYEARFDSSGNLIEITGTRPDGATARLDTSDSTTTVDGRAVTISIPRLNGTSLFDGSLSVDQNTIAGSITAEIELGDLEVTLPGGDLTLERVVDGSDPCDGVTCDPGESCVDGECVADDPCDGVTCDPGESCVDGDCVPQEAEGDPVAGEAYYMANGCAACHGADATGVSAPSLIGADATLIFDKLSGNVTHAGDTFDGVTEQDARDVEAWIASLGF